MTIPDSTKRYLVRLIARGQITQSEAARMAGVARSVVNYWTREIDTEAARQAVLDKLWARRPAS